MNDRRAKYKKIKVGLILDDSDQPRIVWDLIKRSENANYSIDHLIIQKTPRINSSITSRSLKYLKKHGFIKFLSRILFSLITSFEWKLVGRRPEYSNHFDRYPLEEIKIEKTYVDPILSKSGYVYRYSNEDLLRITEQKLDVLIRGGSGILRGEILNICPFGIISFHHANNDVNRGGPPGFWEVYNREPSTGFIIQKLRSELDGGDVLFRGQIGTSPLYIQNQARLYCTANVFLHKLLEELGKNKALPKPSLKTPYSYPLYRMPPLGKQLTYLAKTFIHMGGKVLRKLQSKSYRWGIAYQFTDDWENAVLWRSKIIKNPPNRFLADPFLICKEDKYYCFVEDYDYSIDKAKISVYEIGKYGYRELGVAIEEEFHLSYPFLFEESGEIYMCPETQQAKDIRIYKCIDFPLEWELHQVIMNEVSAVDTTLLKFNDRWWMLTNIDSSGIGEHNSELHLFHADSFDSKNWTSHPLNPLIVDSTRSRNGGLLKKEDGIYRVFQSQGFDLYGESLGIAKIEKLDKTAYQEEVICKISPKFFDKIKGAHTYSFNNGLLVFDFVKIDKHKK